MTTIPSADIASTPSEIARPRLDHPMGIRTILIFFAIMALGLFFTAYSIHKDLTAASTPVTSYLPFLLLGVIALGFEFVNGFHDTANTVATVIYSHSLAPPIAPQIHGTELGPKTTRIAKPRQSAQSGDKRRNLYLPVNGPAIGDLWDMFKFRS
jgi:hypothetical protein